jgi:hypothetical protein
MTDPPFVPPGFVPPHGLETAEFVLEPLGPEHNDLDHAAWSSSMEHIRSTPGFEGSSWPREMTLAENRDDLLRHARDFAAGTGFTYTVLDPDSRDVVGCVYIYPLAGATGAARVTSWVRATRAALDLPLHEAVAGWLARKWPFERVEYAPRP